MWASEVERLIQTLPETDSDQGFLDTLFQRCVDDTRFFLAVFTKIRRDDGVQINWLFNNVQHDYWCKTHTTIDDVDICGSLDNIILKARQYGQSTEELGDIYHDFCFHPGTVSKVISYRGSTSEKLKHIVDLMHESARDAFMAILRKLGCDAEGAKIEVARYLPTCDKDNTMEMYDARTGSLIEFTMEGAKGAGRSATVNRLYGTEYSEWEHVSDVMSGYAGSLAKDGSAQITIDFTGQGIGNAAYSEWWAAYENPAESRFTAHFYGRNDYPYDADFLDQQRKLLRKRFNQEYPATPEEAFMRDDNAIFDHDAIVRCHEREPRYLNEFMTPEELASRIYSHGVDTGEGTPNGNFSVIKSRDVETGLEACPAFREKCGPRKLGEVAARRHKQYPGIWVVENVGLGAATVERIEDKGLPLYRHRSDPKKHIRDCKVGFPTIGPTKRPVLEADYDTAMVETAINLPSENGRREAREYCLNKNNKTGAPSITDSEGETYHDDEVIADMLCVQGFSQALMLLERMRSPEPQAEYTGSMRDDI